MDAMITFKSKDRTQTFTVSMRYIILCNEGDSYYIKHCTMNDFIVAISKETYKRILSTIGRR